MQVVEERNGDGPTSEDADTELQHQQYSSHWDERCGFAMTPESEVMNWSEFNENIYSERILTGDFFEILAEGFLQKTSSKRLLTEDDEEWIDLRPYMIEFPQKVSRFAKLSKALEMFRTYHLRHLLVINPRDDTVAGIITRKDLDAFMRAEYDEEMRRF